MRRRLIVIASSGLGLLVAVMLWGLFWPAPKDAPSISCPRIPIVLFCREISGRVIYHTSYGVAKRMHVVLLSRSSVTLPGITSVELPPLRHPPGGLGLGDWVSMVGFQTRGSHGEQDFHAIGFATASTEVRCRSVGPHAACTERST